MYAYIKRGKVTDIYRVALNCAPHPDVPRIKFGVKDKWVGVDYWTYTNSYTPTRSQRALRIMSKLERDNKTDVWLYVLARKIAYFEVFGVKL